MPSRAVDIAWHEMILMTRAYHAFCDRAFGHYLHHSPESVMDEPMRDSLARTLAAVDSRSAMLAGVPLLFAIDGELGLEDGYAWDERDIDQLRAVQPYHHFADYGGARRPRRRRGDGGGGSSCGGGGCGGGGCWRRRARRVEADHVERLRGASEPAQAELAERLRDHDLLGRRVHAPADEDLARPGGLAQALGEDRHAADGGVVRAVLEADPAERGVALGDADDRVQVVALPAPALGQLPHAVADRDGQSHRPLRGVRARHAGR